MAHPAYQPQPAPPLLHPPAYSSRPSPSPMPPFLNTLFLLMELSSASSVGLPWNDWPRAGHLILSDVVLNIRKVNDAMIKTPSKPQRRRRYTPHKGRPHYTQLENLREMPQSSELKVSSSMPATINSRHTSDGDICTSPGCIHTASNLLTYINSTVDPCDDFYEFSCGSFLKKTRISVDKETVSTFSITWDQLYEHIRALLDEPIEPDEPRPFVLAKTLYQACMNTTAIEGRGAMPLLDMLKRLGGWPVLEGTNWDKRSFSWEKSVYKLRAAGISVDYFLSFDIAADEKDSSKRIISLDQASLGLDREYLNRGRTNKLVMSYYAYMVDIAVLLGADRKRADKELRKSLLFEMDLANISLSQEKRRNRTTLYNPMTIRQLTQNYPRMPSSDPDLVSMGPMGSIPWMEYINRLLAPHAEVTEHEVIVVKVPSYFSKLEAFLKSTSKRTQANYVMWRVASDSISYLTDKLRRRQLQHLTALTGKTERERRWRECSEVARYSMYIAVGALYIKKYFNEKSKANALEMVNDIRQQFRKILTEIDWMDEQTRTAALEKADAMDSHIGYPKEMRDNDILTQFYDQLHLSPDKLMESVLNVSHFIKDYWFGKLREPVNKTDWVDQGHSAIVNAHYSEINSIDIPAGILQGSFFSAARPAYMNYGSIGFIIGHEITHGFDDVGRQYDKVGNLVDWWQQDTKEKYLEKAKCIIDQYSEYSVKEVGLKLNGVNTQDENIADNGGIKEAYYAYKAWSKRHGREPRLPGLEKYSPRQLFWVSAAHTWCAVHRDEAIKLSITTEVHSPDRYRVIGPMSNMPEFAKDFNCPTGSRMNPRKKCKVW